MVDMISEQQTGSRRIKRKDDSVAMRSNESGIVDKVMANINDKYGFAMLRPGSVQKTASPDVIAPSWQPGGPRQSITNQSINTPNIDSKGEEKRGAA